MSAVIPFLRPAAARPGSWSQQELAEFYRVEAALIRAGIGIASEHGLSDEGEPWFVFCRPDGDAIMHFARIDGSYLIASEVMDRPVRGPDFRALIDQIARLHPELLPIPAAAAGTTLVVHPAALLAALVAAAALSLSAEDAHASAFDPGAEGVLPRAASAGAEAAHGQPQPVKAKAAAGSSDAESSRKQLEAVILSAMIFAAEAVAADHRDARAELGLALSDAVSGAPSQTAQGDPTPGSGTASGSGLGAASAGQPAVLTAQGSGASPGAVSAENRIDTSPSLRPDLPGDRAPPQAGETGQPAASFGLVVGPIGAPAETGAIRTGGQEMSPAERSESATGTPDASGAAGSASRGSSAPAQTVDTSAPARAADAGPSDTGSGAPPQAWVNPGGQAVANRAPSAPAVPEANGQDQGHGQGSQAGAAAGDTAQASRGHGQGSNVPGSQAGAQDGVQVEQAGNGKGQGNTSQGKGNGPKAEATAGDGGQVEQAGKANGNSQGDNGQGKGNGPKAEAVAGDGPQVEQHGQGNGNGHGPKAGVAAEDTAQADQAGQGPGDGSQTRSAAQHESGPSPHGNGKDHGSANPDKAIPAGADTPPAGGSDTHGHGPDPAEQSDHRGPAAHGAHGIDQASGPATPERSADVRSDAAIGGHGPDKATNAAMPNDGDGAAAGEPSGRGHASDHGAAPPNGSSPDTGPPSPGHGRSAPPDHGPGHGADATPSSDLPNGGPPAVKAHGASASEVAAPASADFHAASAVAQAPHPHGEQASHGQRPDAAAPGPHAQDGSGAAPLDGDPGPGSSALAGTRHASTGHVPSPADQAPADHGAGGGTGPTTSATGPDTVDGGLSTPSIGPSPVAASQPGSPSQAGNAPADHGHGQGVVGHPTDDRAGHGPGGGPTDQAPAAQPQTASGNAAAIEAAALQPGSTGGTPNDPSGHSGPNPDPSAPPRAAIDPSGNLVFHADHGQDAGRPAASHGPDEAAAHPTIGLVGISDQPHPVHDLYHHT